MVLAGIDATSSTVVSKREDKPRGMPTLRSARLNACPLLAFNNVSELRLDDGVEIDLAVLDGEDRQGLDGIMELVEGDLARNAVELDVLEGLPDGVGVYVARGLDGGQEKVGGVIGEHGERVRDLSVAGIV